MRGSAVKIRTPEEVSKAREAGRLAAQVLHMITPHVQPGVSTDAIDKLCHAYIVEELNVTPANIGYHGYTKTVCASVNHEVVHGFPSNYELKDGDVLKIDGGAIVDGWHSDSASRSAQ